LTHPWQLMPPTLMVLLSMRYSLPDEL